MKFSEQWLRTLVDPKVSTDTLLEQLTMAGLEVDSVAPASGGFTDVVVAKVEAVEKHPDADKLNVCQVTDGSNRWQIVCGAANVREGLLTPLARVGAELPGDFKIKQAKLRGVESNGMLCSEKELGLAESSPGIMELPSDAPVGTALREYMQLDDTVIEVDLTPNRGDCLSLTGVAREVAVMNQCDWTPVTTESQSTSIEDTFPVSIQASDACSHYVGRIVKGVDVNVETPLWMVERLRRSGIQSIDPIVDVTNYVMMELGQPMHAFDLSTLDREIVVKFAENGDKITLLDGKSVELDNNTLLIADRSRPLALAGIMGGENSGISSETKDIFLESAYFDPIVIAGKARSYGLHTDSSHRFERGVDPALQNIAIERATALITEICGGEIGPLTDVKADTHPESRQEIQLRPERIKRVLGIALDDAEVENILTRLGMQLVANDRGWLVSPPRFRFDISIEADLLEELVRIYGYDNIPRSETAASGGMQEFSEQTKPIDTIKQSLVQRGYFEAITYSFIDPALQKRFAPSDHVIELSNPISSEMSVMRSSMWPGLVNAVRHNLNRQQDRVRLFETGLCFEKADDGGILQTNRIAGVICGDVYPEQWASKGLAVDFYDIKSDVESLLDGLEGITYESSEHVALHPGQTASIQFQGKNIGWVGALHPQLQNEMDIEKAVYVFEIDIDIVQKAAIPVFSPLSKYPEVRRDLAIIVDEAVSADAIKSCILESSSELLKHFQIFDVYKGKGVESGRKSVAFGLILQGFSSTLTEQEVDNEIENIVNSLKSKFTATLRE